MITISFRERQFNLRGGMALLKKNILIPNVAEKNILILVEEKKIRALRDKKKYSNSRVVRNFFYERNKKP